MAEEGYKTTTIYQTRIALYNMLEFARENDVLIANPCKKSVKSDMGKPSAKKEALTIEEKDWERIYPPQCNAALDNGMCPKDALQPDVPGACGVSQV